MIIVNTIQDAVKEIQGQLQAKDFYLHNYALLEGVVVYLDSCIDKSDEGEQIYNYLAYALKWEDRGDELFPMEL